MRLKTIKYKEYNFNDLAKAIQKKKLIKKHYGYEPSIFKKIDRKKTKYVIVKPLRLRRIDRL
jgi:hypothetical protein